MSNWGKLRLFLLRQSSACAVLIVGGCFSVLSWYVVDQRIRERTLLEIDGAIADATGAIEGRLRSTHDIMLGLQGLFHASNEVTRIDFSRYLAGLDLTRRHSSIRTINFAPLVSAKHKHAFEEAARRDRSENPAGYPTYEIKPAGARSEYVPILYRVPSQGSERALGLDLLTEDRRESVERARDLNQITLSLQIALATAPSGEPGFGMRAPVYRPGSKLDTVEERRAAFVGVLTASFLVRDVVGDVFAHTVLNPMAVRLYDSVEIAGASNVGAAKTEYLLYEKSPWTVFKQTDRDHFFREVKIEVGGRHWVAHFEGRARDFMSPTDRALPWILLSGGIVVTLLLSGLIRSLASSRAHAEQLAIQITEDLRLSEARLIEAQRLTQSMIEALPNPIFFKGTDGCYQGVNQAWERFFGRRREDFIGKSVYDLFPSDRAVAERMDLLDQALWRSPGSQTYEAVIPAADNVMRDVVYYKATYGRSDGEVVGLIGTMIDITERKQSERRREMEHAVTRVLAEAEDLREAVPRILRTVCETMGWHYGDHYVLDPELDALRRQDVWYIDTPEMQAFDDAMTHRIIRTDQEEMTKGLIRRAYALRQAVWIADLASESGVRRGGHIARAGLHGAFAFPVVANNHVLGVMEFFHTEIRQPDETLLAIAQSIGSQVGQFLVRMQAEEAVKFFAMHDALTHLPNRTMFNQRLESAITHAERHRKRLAVMFIDLDRFKIINDTLGHESGDLLLREMAQRITDNLRAGDMVARLGGDEFVVLLEDVPDTGNVAVVADKLIAALSSSLVIAGREVHVTASIGICSYPQDARDIRTLMKFADIAMYRAKEQGRNTYQFYSEKFNVHSVERLTLESQLRGALDRDELVLHYQPVIDAGSGRITGMEALVRWQNPQGGLLPPAQFISIAEDTGLIVPIGAWVVRAACAQHRAWVDLGLPPVSVAVNLSPRQFAHRYLVEDIERVLEETGCETRYLELEITEGTVMHNAAHAIELLGKLKEMGIRISIDDFGTGYSSLSYLKRFPIDSLKIDRSFVADVPHDATNTAITRAILAMAHSLGLKVVGEGVETSEQHRFLRENGCDEMQGYYFSMPLNIVEATSLLTSAAQGTWPGNKASSSRALRIAR